MDTSENPTNGTDASNGHASENPTNGENKTTGTTDSTAPPKRRAFANKLSGIKTYKEISNPQNIIMSNFKGNGDNTLNLTPMKPKAYTDDDPETKTEQTTTTQPSPTTSVPTSENPITTSAPETKTNETSSTPEVVILGQNDGFNLSSKGASNLMDQMRQLKQKRGKKQVSFSSISKTNPEIDPKTLEPDAPVVHTITRITDLEKVHLEKEKLERDLLSLQSKLDSLSHDTLSFTKAQEEAIDKMKREVIEKEEINLKLSNEISLLQQQNKELQEQKEQQERKEQQSQQQQPQSPAKNEDLDSSTILYKEICETLAFEKATVEDELKQHKKQLAELQSKLIAAAESPTSPPSPATEQVPILEENTKLKEKIEELETKLSKTLFNLSQNELNNQLIVLSRDLEDHKTRSKQYLAETVQLRNAVNEREKILGKFQENSPDKKYRQILIAQMFLWVLVIITIAMIYNKNNDVSYVRYT